MPFEWFKKKSRPATVDELVAEQPPGIVFPWPKGKRLTALDETLIMVPEAIIAADEVFGSVIRADDDVLMHLPTRPDEPNQGTITFLLQPGQSIWLTKSCDGMVVPRFKGDAVPRRLRITDAAQ